MAASRTTSNTITTALTASGRLSFGKIREPLEVPDLLALQTESFDWLLGNERWQARVAAAKAEGRDDVPDRSGLEEIFEEISPIEDFSGSMSLSFRDHRFEEVKYSIEDCKERDQTYSAPLFVTAEFMNNTTGEIKSQTVFMGDFPLMTERGTFIINGTERVVVSQLVRSPGVYFERTPDKTSDKDIYTSKVIPSRGAWLEFEIDKRDMVGVRVDRKRKQSVTVLLKALGWTNDRILEEFGDYESMRLTLEKDHTTGQDDALLDIYRKLRPGEPPTKEAAQTLLDNLYFNGKRYDLAKVGRYKINKKLGLEGELSQSTLAIEDIVATIKYIVALHAGEETIAGRRRGEDVEVRVETDDIDHFGNRRLRNVGELIQNQVRTGLSRMERVVRERMTTQDVEAITPQTLINIRPVVASIKEFFGTSQLSQFMDQNNPLAGLTHKRRLSALGPGGLSRDRAGMEVRDVHPSHYGRMCPIETPEGPNIGLIGSLASYGRINAFGFIETPYRKVEKGRITDDVHYLSADEEDEHVIAQANATLTEDGTHFAHERVLVRVKGGEVEYVPAVDVDYIDVSARQMVSAATALIPFLEHDDANRALMGSNMQRQAVPLVRSEAPLVGTGMEYRAAVDSGDVVVAEKAGVVTEVSADLVTVAGDDGTSRTYRINKFNRSNQGNSYNQRVVVAEGDRVEAGGLVADGPATDGGEMALGRNLLVAFMPWEGHNYEDAIILSQRLVQDDVLSSIHIEEHEVDARDTKLGPEEITRDIPNVSDEVLADLDERGIIRIGAEVRDGDLLVGKVTPKGETELTPEERLLRAIFGEKAREVRDTSPQGAPRRDRHGHRRQGLRQGRRRRAAPGRQPAGAGLRREQAEDHRRRQARRPPRQQGGHLQDPPRRGHALPRGRHPGRRRAQPARRPRPDEHRADPRAPPRLGRQPRLGDRGQPGLGPAHPGGRPHAPAGTRVASPVFDGVREDEIIGLLDSTRPDAGRRPAHRRHREGHALRRPLRRAVPRAGVRGLHVHPQAAPPRGRQDPRAQHRPVLDDHPAAARR